MVGDPGVEPGLPCSQSRRVTVSLASGGEVRNRTGSPTLARRGRCLTCHPQSGRTGNLRPAEAALCQLELAAHRGAAPGTGLSPGVAGLSFAAPHQCRGRMAPAADAHAMDMSKSKPVKGAQGPQELNPHSARVGAGPPNRWLIPIKGEPPGGNLLGRFPVTQSSVLPGNLRDAQGTRHARLAVPTA